MLKIQGEGFTVLQSGNVLTSKAQDGDNVYYRHVRLLPRIEGASEAMQEACNVREATREALRLSPFNPDNR